MDNDKIFLRYVLVFVVIFGILGFLSGNFFAFFPGSAFILLIVGIFVGLVFGVITGLVVRFRKLSEEKDKYKI
ncbi:MAG: hypothetical protein RMJ36_00155 [Candidatus Calescibacterium sp.]|nr:DUF4407 domain-containing protein [Candidatus Calescibacterium sp.]MDW8132057.1 hypothetical protein [Candidatus Calescibacterium sp.]